MKRALIQITLTVGILCDLGARAATHYVNIANITPAAPYDSWEIAATNIQDAVDAAVAGETVLVTNGVYATGGRAVYGLMTNRVAVDKPIALQSVNGPDLTVIQGRQVPGTPNGDGAIRCVYLTNGAVLSGFTLTNGATRSSGDYFREGSGGGVYCESTNAAITNCTLTGNWACNAGGGANSGTLDNCALTGNRSGEDGGGARSGTLNNCALTGNWAYYDGGGANSAILVNCVVTGNSAERGGGILGGVLLGGTLSGNSAKYGGGAFWSTLNYCTITSNSVWSSGRSDQGMGGGTYYCDMMNCVLTYNTATNGGGAYGGTLEHCTLSNNFASWNGGGAYAVTGKFCTLSLNFAVQGGGAYTGALSSCEITRNSSYGGGGVAVSILTNCAIWGNEATFGGGAFQSTLENCTLLNNLAFREGGGALGANLNNCILYYNKAPVGPNYIISSPVGFQSRLNYCCTTPQPTNGAGNIIAEPQLASISHLSTSSPCRNTGRSAYAFGADIDGEPWLNPPSIGCDEFQNNFLPSPVSVSIQTKSTNVTVGWPLNLTAVISGEIIASAWDFDDGTGITNQPFANHAWNTPGDYTVVLQAYRGTNGTVSESLIIHVVPQPVLYVAGASKTPIPPYNSWETAAQTIQDAIEAATVAGSLILVTNGTYATGGRPVSGQLTNRIAVTQAVEVRSFNGPALTLIQGFRDAYHGIRCVHLAEGAVLSGFTLTNGGVLGEEYYGPDNSAGGVLCESTNALLTNCIIRGNLSSRAGAGVISGTLINCVLMDNSGGEGGGAYGSVLNNCILITNNAQFGGGSYYGILNNCTLVGNSSGAFGSTLCNCIVYYNGLNYSQSQFTNSCTLPMPTNGPGNITNPPAFIDLAGGNLRLQTNSPCINAGNNAYAIGSTDLDGRPRIVGGTVDMGAYEFQGPGMGEFIPWLQKYAFPIDGSADFLDPDHDGLNNFQEWRCGTDPTNAASALCLLPPHISGSDLLLTWPSMPGLNYVLECSTNLSTAPAFSTLASNLPAQSVTSSFTVTNAISNSSAFYRIRLQD